MINRTMLLIVLVPCVTLTTVYAVALARPHHAQNLDAEAVAAQRVETATDALKEVRQLLVDNKGDTDWVPQFLIWQGRLYESKYAAAKTKDERIQIVEQRVETLKSGEKTVKVLIEKGEKTKIDGLEWRYRVLEMEAFLHEVRAAK